MWDAETGEMLGDESFADPVTAASTDVLGENLLLVHGAGVQLSDLAAGVPNGAGLSARPRGRTPMNERSASARGRP